MSDRVNRKENESPEAVFKVAADGKEPLIADQSDWIDGQLEKATRILTKRAWPSDK